MRDDQADKERAAQELANELARAAMPEAQIAREVRDAFGSFVEPAVVARAAIASVGDEMAATPVTQAHDNALARACGKEQKLRDRE